MRKNVKIVYLLVGLLSLSFIMPGIHQVSGQDENLSGENDLYKRYLTDLNEKYLNVLDLKTRDQPVKGTGIDEEGKTCAPSLGPACDVALLKENLITAAAFSMEYKNERDEESYEIAKNDLYFFISKLKSQYSSKYGGYKHSDEIHENLESRIFAIDQFLYLEFISEMYENMKVGAMLYNLKEAFNFTLGFLADYNETLGNKSPYGAYWTAIQNERKLSNANQNPGIATNPIYNPFPNNYNDALMNNSLWAAAGLAHYASILKSSTTSLNQPDGWRDTQAKIEDLELNHEKNLKEIFYNLSSSGELDDFARYSIAVEMAKQAFSCAELYAWNNSLSLFGEKQLLQPQKYLAETQIIAFLASARLFEATEEFMYLEKAQTILNSLVSRFWDSGKGGLFHTFVPGMNYEMRESGVKWGYDNALLAYALVQLADAQGAMESRFIDFWEFEKPINDYFDLAEAIVQFMNDQMYFNSSSSNTVGYTEWLNYKGDRISQGDSDESARFVTTNMLVYYTLNSMVIKSQSFADFYMNYIIYMSIGGVAVFLLLYLWRHRQETGAEMPSVVRSMMAKND